MKSRWFIREFDRYWVKCRGCGRLFMYEQMKRKNKCPKCKLDNCGCLKTARPGGHMTDPKQTIDDLIESLQEYQRFNRLHNDTDEYLYALGEYALGESIKEKPNPDDYGVNSKSIA